MTRFLGLLALATVSFGCHSAGVEKLVFDPASVFEHRASGFEFPTRIGGFEREKIRRYDADGNDIGVTYRLDQVTISVYVFPPPRYPDGTEGPWRIISPWRNP